MTTQRAYATRKAEGRERSLVTIAQAPILHDSFISEQNFGRLISSYNFSVNSVMAYSQPVCVCETTDSALSITANVISIVTLAYVLLLGVLYQVALKQRSKDSTGGLREDVKHLRQKLTDIKSMISPNHDKPNPIFAQLLEKASVDLISVERELSRTFSTAANSDKWYVVWGQLKHMRKRAALRRDVSAVNTRLDLCVQAW